MITHLGFYGMFATKEGVALYHFESIKKLCVHTQQQQQQQCVSVIFIPFKDRDEKKEKKNQTWNGHIQEYYCVAVTSFGKLIPFVMHRQCGKDVHF